MKKGIIILFAVLTYFCVISFSHGQDNVLEGMAESGVNIEDLYKIMGTDVTDLEAVTSLNGDLICDKEDVKQALELALKYLNPPNPITKILQGPFYPINMAPETEIEKLKRLAGESRVEAERLEQKARDIQFIRDVYEGLPF